MKCCTIEHLNFTR